MREMLTSLLVGDLSLFTAKVMDLHSFLRLVYSPIFFFLYCIYDTRAWQSHCIYITGINKILSLIIAEGAFKKSSD